ncbi:cysteine desulfurase CsdA [Lactobacillus sp.] [Lactiplantibacillus mudanjiangensis]|uniref:aminotransferase class V-fold PLP-dependent enzyme n=1 Tax=Lactiplantibacillus mudanjiangensis TaxID=1296538 RepID=UPI001014C12E|nr:cysteine desulfurase [Lactiplantibacillus mudanjiangensis]VDG33497.1 cysteine desulfurase CsdA [Lactobacillus sp.] [Lactiplantibacillus mudanjiangensis]
MGKMIKDYRADFPILQTTINGEPLTYLDSAATSQKPQAVIDAITAYYTTSNANVHRGVYTLAAQATDQYEAVRDQVATFIHAPQRESVFFTRSTTESLNWVAQTYGEQFIEAGDEIVLTAMEHHSNLVPWQQLAQRKHAKLRYIQLLPDGQLDMADANQKITAKTKLVAVAQTSNVLGVTNPIKQLAALAHQHRAVIMVDGAQAVAHQSVDVQAMDVDFYAFSGHKMLGPTGVGVLYGKLALLEQLTPAQFGGEMIDNVDWQTTTFAAIPQRFEAGTPNISGVIGLGAAITYLQQVGWSAIQTQEKTLTMQLLTGLAAMDGVTVYGPLDANFHGPVVAFNVAGVHPHDVATGLDMDGIEVRAGHHCAQPLMQVLNVESTVRASLMFYNTSAEIDRLLTTLAAVKEFFQG